MNFKSFYEEKLGLTQSEIARLLKVEPSQISHWENHPRDIPWSVFYTIAEKTGVLPLGKLTVKEKFQFYVYNTRYLSQLYQPKWFRHFIKTLFYKYKKK